MWDLKHIQETRAHDLMREAEHQRTVQAVSRKRVTLPARRVTRLAHPTLLWRARSVLRLAFGME